MIQLKLHSPRKNINAFISYTYNQRQNRTTYFDEFVAI
ncbi:hypothetical protein D027_3429 [Vibrio parahaemolyticus 861]|nr:conserved hypothetical protein [Vibrio parahaemolyticus AN-5034]EQL95793.1 hypothetical protein D035_2200 [Vibrio parahaemolyticus VP250]EQM02442.1 hypothetical protein D036_3822 [Vibrio parahaemolyticus VP232]EQM05193.1 hypothetical protein D045_4664 [Vibrio parahaemolyticus VP-NY4]EQM06247.1 hypothetical protein D040_4709 [Vibrio parahaemolyticus NIHCB0603]EQM42529.1 hypothetical protein D025_4894 [Vibrio parahaemolyticus 949]ETX23342.1 hypothetical protein D037_3162 [Vibrio parahaemolyt